ncbi:MAG TPA: type II secretion system protein [Tepidisphaeraceae bacterium]|jgi:prepilin-type processing-associated H-X9-DG protein|nr:type II secretion system protein [Tepidisphaeraceae bacterium]
MRAQKAHPAFTLVELLVVIFVIALLIGLLMPALRGARESAMQIRCAANLRQWTSAAMMYANQEHGWLPRRGQGAQATTVLDRPTDWFNALPPMFHATPYIDLVNQGQMPRPGNGSIWMCPVAVDGGQTNFFAYAMNMRLSTWNAPNPDRINRVGPWSNLVFMTDAPGAYCSVLPANANYSPIAPHHGRLNIAFMDGHVASYKGDEVGCGVGDPHRVDVRWIIPDSTWAGPGAGGS